MKTFKLFNNLFYALLLLILSISTINCRAQYSEQDSSEEMNASMSDESGKQEIHKSFTAVKGQRLDLNLKTGGSISIKGWNKEEVQVDASLNGNDWENIVVDFEKNESGIDIVSRYKHHLDNQSSNVHFDIMVPSKFDIQVNTMGGGLKIEDVNGDVKGKTMGGDLDLSGLKGYLDLSTMGGHISLTNSDVDGNLHTMGGSVNFENVTGDVKGSSMGGKVTMKNVTRRNSSSIGDEVDISSMGGEINVDDAPSGANVSTMGGSINVHSAKKFVKAKTMGGSIEITEVDGAVKATTMGGKINVKEICKPGDTDRDIELESYGGDIKLLVPADFSMDIDVTLAYTKNRDHHYEIISDFDIIKSQSDKWDSTKGSSRKYIYGKAKVNGGRNRVIIKTVNGDIHIEKI